MAPARAFWKGYLKLSLVSCPIALYAGTSSTERVSLRQINKKTGNRLRQHQDRNYQDSTHISPHFPGFWRKCP